jgi:tRNA pseudouridine55 synthase
MEIFNTYKPLGWTPLQVIEHLQKTNSDLIGKSITYAGRLDPAAEGVLILLTGEAIKNKDAFLNLPKIYHAKFLFGVATDSYDVLGLATKAIPTNFELDKIREILNTYLGKRAFTLPPYSSAVVKGKALFQWARENRLKEIELPKKEFEIKKIALQNLSTITAKSIYKTISNTINLVQGDFRQNQITTRWQENLQNGNQNFQVLELILTVGSGTYIRAIADQIGKDLGSSAILFSLVRTEVGNYNIEDSIVVK